MLLVVLAVIVVVVLVIVVLVIVVLVIVVVVIVVLVVVVGWPLHGQNLFTPVLKPAQSFSGVLQKHMLS
jgi:hypothetical protein